MNNQLSWKFTRNWRPIIGGCTKQYVPEPSALARSNASAQYYRVPGNDYTLSRMSENIGITVDEDNNGDWQYDELDDPIDWISFKGGSPDLIPGIPIEKPVEDILAKSGGSQRQGSKRQAPWHADEKERERITDKIMRLLPSRGNGAVYGLSCLYHDDAHPSASLTVWQKGAGHPRVYYKCWAAGCMKSNEEASQNPLQLDDAFVLKLSVANLVCKTTGQT
jgi:hypothetical protein